MISTQQIIYCTNTACTNPINPIGNSVCASCQTPLVHRYLWASGSSATAIKPGDKVAHRYEVIKPQIWLDTLPGLLPDIPEELPKEIIPYLRLYQQRLHLPQVYGFVHSPTGDKDDILLLENVLDETGKLYPAIADAWTQAKAVRQVYWLWQILQLWIPLSELGVASSLLIPENLRVQGWCVRLMELVHTHHGASIQQLGECWKPWVTTAKTSVVDALNNIVQQMCDGEANLEDISAQLNTLLLSAAGELPLTLHIAGATDIGAEELQQNEDACYPLDSTDPDESLLPNVAIICDGIGGHEGGEVASQLAVQSLKLQIRALLMELAEQTEFLPPDVLYKQLEAILRIVNNVICNCNDEQNREGTQRMGTALLMAVQLPQRVRTTSGWQSKNAHELYLANIGDSRAYWITRNYCQLLTVDDDVATREVRHARSLYRKALQRPDATALTQALGTKDGEFLRPFIQRFILEEDGILLLCSDGLSDNNWVEHSWRDYAVPVLIGDLSLQEAARQWIDLARQKNAHDNVSVVLSHCRISLEYLVPVTRALPVKVQIEEEPEEELELIETTQAFLELDVKAEAVVKDKTQTPVKTLHRPSWWMWFGGLLILLVGATSLGLFAWWKLSPQTFQPTCRQLPLRMQRFCETRE